MPNWFLSSGVALFLLRSFSCIQVTFLVPPANLFIVLLPSHSTCSDFRALVYLDLVILIWLPGTHFSRSYCSLISHNAVGHYTPLDTFPLSQHRSRNRITSQHRDILAMLDPLLFFLSSHSSIYFHRCCCPYNRIISSDSPQLHHSHCHHNAKAL